MELVQVCRNKRELKDISAFFSENFSRVIYCDGAISEKAISLLKTYALSRGLRTVDAIIAATAIAGKASFATRNYRHFSMMDEMTKHAAPSKNEGEPDKRIDALSSQFCGRGKFGHKAERTERGRRDRPCRCPIFLYFVPFFGTATPDKRRVFPAFREDLPVIIINNC